MPETAAAETNWLERASAQSFKRLLPRLEARFAAQVAPEEWAWFVQRMEDNFQRLFQCLHRLYGAQYDFFYHLENILTTATQMWIDRPDDLKALDGLRASDPLWFQSHRMVGAMCYVDLFAGDLKGLIEHIPYLAEMGITYLHLMPCFKSPEGDNDGGYAVSSYREIHPSIGTMDDLEQLAAELRLRGISLVVDFVFNHTSDEHEWARSALDGDAEFQEYYRMFPSRELPDAYEKSIRAVFPDELPGCFTYNNRIKRWVWTTFYTFQWDLNYENPVLFNRMLEEMLFLANRGVEVLRLDAVAFIWKRLGTGCQNLPEAHIVVQAFNAIKKMVCPAMVFKSEAIVHPDEVRKYISEDECELSYNPQLMALLWDALATRDTRVLSRALRRNFEIDPRCAWVNYIRCHDDIGWGFADEDIEASDYDPHAHRNFLTRFYTGRFNGTFARGRPFQEDPSTGDGRVSGTCASLAGLEEALERQDEHLIELAVRRIIIMHGIIMTMGGIPLLYLGDELGQLNDYTYEQDPDKAWDSRWLHRGRFDWDMAEQRGEHDAAVGRIYGGLCRLIQLRQQNLAFSRAETDFVDTGNPHVFAYFRSHELHTAFVIANFSEHPQQVEAWRLRQLGLRKSMVDLYSGKPILAMRTLEMEPYQFTVLSR